MTPAYRILADQRNVTAAIRDRLLSLTLTDEAGYQSDTVELRLDDRDGKIALPRKGVRLEVLLGYEETGLAEMGVYAVDEVELSGPPDTLTIRAKAADMRSTLKQQKTRSWHDTTLDQVLATIASEHGLEPKMPPPPPTIHLPHLDQTNESDLHFLTRLGQQYDHVAKPAGGYLLFVPRGEAKAASGRAVPPATIHRSQTSDHRVTLADRGKHRAVVAHWQDVAAGKQVAEHAGEGEPVYTLRHTYPTAEEARAAAQAKLKSLTRGQATISLTLIPGNPILAAEAKLTLSGFRTGVDGEWVATQVTHDLSDSGYTSRVEAETPTKK